jgi:hypothetical protein
MKITKTRLREIIKEEIHNLSENKTNTIEIADIFARFLIGDRKAAIRQLQSHMKSDFGIVETPGTAEYNTQFGRLTKKLDSAIKSEM